MKAQKKRRRATLVLFAILALAALVRLGHLTCHRAAPLGRPEEQFLYSDIRAFSVWAKGIAAGDLLCRETYHPYMEWMEEIAPLETFEAWWGGKEIYHQAPLYPYLLALSYTLAGSPLPLLLFQVGLALLAIHLLYRLGRRFLDERAGLAAAAAAALFAPAVVLDALVLRSSLIASLTIITTWLLLELRRRPGPGRGAAAGVLLGLGILLKPTGLLLALLGPILLLTLLRPPGPVRRWLPALAAGLLLCLAPLAARNLAVGAPVTALGTRGPETIYQANNRHADPGFFQVPPAGEYRAAMEKAQGSLFAALGTAIGTWPEEGRLAWWLWHLGRKLQCTFLDYEHPNNTNFYYYRRQTPGLSRLPTFGWYAGLAAVGLVLLVRRTSRRKELLLPLAAFLTLLAGLLIAFVHGRYRMPPALLLALPLGATCSTLLHWLGRRRWLPAALAGLAVVLLSWYSFAGAPTRVSFQDGGPPTFYRRQASHLIQALAAERFAEYEYAARELLRRGEKEAAEAHLDGHLARLRAIGRDHAADRDRVLGSILAAQQSRNLDRAADLYTEMGLREKAARLRRKR